MKWQFPSSMLLSVCLCHCTLGTEVGNGVRPTPKPDETKAESSPTSAGNTAPDSVQSDSKAPMPSNISPYLIVACASPLAENIDGRFVDDAGQIEFKVEPGTGNTRLLTWTMNMQIYTIQPAALSGAPYAIEALSSSPTLSCGPVTSQTLTDGNTKRSVTFSNFITLNWVLEAGTVIEISVTDQGKSLANWKKSEP